MIDFKGRYRDTIPCIFVLVLRYYNTYHTSLYREVWLVLPVLLIVKIKNAENALESLKQALREVGKINKDELLVGGLGNVPVVHKETYRKFFNDTCKGANKARDFDNTLKSLEKRRYVGINGDYLWAIEE